MRRLVTPAIACLLLVAGCGGGDDAAPADTQIDPVEETQTGRPFIARSIPVELDAVGGSEPTGVATLSPIQEGDPESVSSGTRFTVEVAEGSAERAVLVRGSCDAPGDELGAVDVEGGQGTTTLETPLETLVEGDELLAVLLLAAGEVAACGNVEEATED